jgi:hypothetical protein
MDHYKDSFAILLGHWKARNRLFVYVLLLIAIIGGLSPSSLSDLVNGYLKKAYMEKDQVWRPLDFAVIGLLARFLLLCLVIQYYQRSILVDRQYKYIHHIEEQLCKFTGGDYITREGRAYFSRKGVPSTSGKDQRRPLFLRCVGPLYVYIFPLVLSVLVIWKLIEWDLCRTISAVSILSALCSLGVVTYSVFYMIWIRWRR